MGDNSFIEPVLVDKLPQTSSSPTVLSNGRLKDEYYKPVPPDFFAPKTGDQILNIGVVGAGIAGLAAAIALVQSGHNVEVSSSLHDVSYPALSNPRQIYERSRFANEIGAAINVCPNACRALSFFEFNFERPRPTVTEEVSLFNLESGHQRSSRSF